MIKQSNRQRRIAQQIQREIAIILQRELQEPALKMVTVSQVQVSGDLQFAKIYVTFLSNTPEAVKTGLSTLKEKTAYIRSLLASALSIRLVPIIKFVYDETMTEGLRMSQLIDKAISEDAKRRDQSNT